MINEVKYKEIIQLENDKILGWRTRDGGSAELPLIFLE